MAEIINLKAYRDARTKAKQIDALDAVTKAWLEWLVLWGFK